jgi:hypothetical protein
VQFTVKHDEAVDDAARFQLLLNALLPPPAAEQDEQPTFLPLGAPVSTDRQVQSALDIIKPSQRFPLLLVGSVAP